MQRPCERRTKRKSHEESYDSSWDFGALEGTRIPGPLIKRIQCASFVESKKNEETQIHSHYRKIDICTHRIICIQQNALQPLSSHSGVQKMCKNVQTGKTKPNGQINHRFYGRVQDIRTDTVLHRNEVHHEQTAFLPPLRKSNPHSHKKDCRDCFYGEGERGERE